jgi:AcrR family transcriptional regulator
MSPYRPRNSRTRERILTAMVEVAAQVGIRNSSVELVIERAGTSRAGFYAHFSDTGDCFRGALEICAERLFVAIEQAVVEALAEEAAGAMIEVLIAFSKRDRSAARLVFIESLAGGPPTLEVRDRLCVQTTALIKGRWEELGQYDALVDGLIQGVIGGVFRLVTMRLGHTEASLDGLEDDLGAWIDCYKISAGLPKWGNSRGLRSAKRLPVASLGSRDLSSLSREKHHRLTSTELACSQRLRILGGITKCSFEQGFGTIRVADIVATAGISRKAFYEQFHGKSDAATAAIERTFQAGISVCAGAFFGASEWPERIWAGGSALLSFLAAHPEDAYLSFVEPHAIGPATAQHAYSRVAAFTLFLEEGYRYRPEAGVLPRTCSEVLGAVMFELAFRELRERRSAGQLLQILPELVYVCLAPFMGSEAATKFVESKLREQGSFL